RLDRDLAALAGLGLHAALVGAISRRRNVIADLPQMEGVAHVDCAHAGIEPGNEHDAIGVHRRLILVRRVRAETAAAAAETAAAAAETAALRNVERRNADRTALVGDIGDEDHLARLEALVDERLVDDENEVALAAALVAREFRKLHAEHRQSRMRAGPGRQVEASDLRR